MDPSAACSLSVSSHTWSAIASAVLAEAGEYDGTKDTGPAIWRLQTFLKTGGQKFRFLGDRVFKAEVKVGGRIGAISGSQKVAEGKVSFLPAPAAGEGGFEPLIINGPR